MNQDHPRFIELQGCVNFRDLGGYAASNGKTVTWGELFRSDSVHLMSDQDTDYVYNNLGIVTRIDLRNAEEVHRDGGTATVPASATYRHVPFLELRGISKFDPNVDAAARLGEIYLWILANCGGQLVGLLNTFADESQTPAVFHCTAGKDRTGVLSALILSVLGVSEDQIMADFLLTNQNMDLLYKRLQAIPGNEQRPRSSFEAPPKAMEGALAALNGEYGGSENYVKTHGATQSALDRLRASHLE